MASWPLPLLSQNSSWRPFPLNGMLKPGLLSHAPLGLQVTQNPLVNSKSCQYSQNPLTLFSPCNTRQSCGSAPGEGGIIVVLEHALSLQTMLCGAGDWWSESFPWITELLPCALRMAPSPVDSLPDPSSLRMAVPLSLMCEGTLLKTVPKQNLLSRTALLVQAGAHHLHFSSTHAEVSFSSQGLSSAPTEIIYKGAPYMLIDVCVHTKMHSLFNLLKRGFGILINAVLFLLQQSVLGESNHTYWCVFCKIITKSVSGGRKFKW